MHKVTDFLAEKAKRDALPSFTEKHDGGGGDMLEARVAKLESDVDNIKTMVKDIKDDVLDIKRDARGDFRLLFGALIAVALGLAGIMAKGFGWL